MRKSFCKPKCYFPQKEITIYVDKNNIIHAKYKDENGIFKFAEISIQENTEANFLNGAKLAISNLN